MTPITIDAGIGDILQAISSIIARGKSERERVWDSLAHQLEAVSLTVGELDRTYFVLLAEIEDVFAQPQLSLERVNTVIEQASTYCTDERPVLQLAEWRGAIQEAAFNYALKHRRYRILASTLRSIDDPLERYIERLNRLQEGSIGGVPELVHSMPTNDSPETRAKDQQWDLRTVLELLKLIAIQLGKDGKFGDGLEDPSEVCEEAIRNYNRALSLALVQLIGHARQDLARGGRRPTGAWHATWLPSSWARRS